MIYVGIIFICFFPLMYGVSLDEDKFVSYCFLLLGIILLTTGIYFG